MAPNKTAVRLRALIPVADPLLHLWTARKWPPQLRQSARWGACFVWLPLGTGIVIALALRYLVGGDPLTLTPRWWYVVGSYALAVGILFVIVVTVLRIGPYGATCWPDMRVIASRFLPAKV
jgi:hypothetical protein